MAETSGEEKSLLSAFFQELVTSPINLGLLGLCCFLLYKIVKGRKVEEPGPPPEPKLPPLKKQDMTVQELSKYNGDNEDGRILIAVNGKVFDVTRGKKFYGPGGPYGIFAGRDASRGLATFSVSEEAIKDEYDDLSDLNSMQMESMREWEMQFTEKYDFVGRLLKPGDKAQDYSDTEEEHSVHDKKED